VEAEAPNDAIETHIKNNYTPNIAETLNRDDFSADPTTSDER